MTSRPEVQNKLFFVAVFVITAGLLYLLAPILTPFLAGALLAYLSDPLVEKIVSWKVPRILGAVIVFLGLFFVIFLIGLLLIPVIETQVMLLVSSIPEIIAKIQSSFLPWLNETFGIQDMLNVDTLKSTLAENWTKAGGVANWLVSTVFHSGRALIEWVTNLVLIPVVTFYLLRDWNVIIKNIRSLLPRHIEPIFVKLAVDCDHTLSAFFRGQLLVMLSLGAIYSIGLSLVGLKLGIVIGCVAGLLSIVPYLGFIIGITTASIAAFSQFGTTQSVFIVCAVFAIGQSIESVFLTPKLVGHRIGLHPVAVIFAVLTGGMLFGFFGVLLALPAAAVIMVCLRYLTERYRSSQLYQ